MTINICWVALNHKQTITHKETVIHIATPIATLRLYFLGRVITKTQWCFETVGETVAKNKLARAIQLYLQHKSCHLDITLAKQGTSYRHKVWHNICQIPIGQVMSYSQLAKNIGSGARAVANACRDNPFPPIIPCHRVVATSGLGGYMGQTHGIYLATKQKLLAKEKTINDTHHKHHKIIHKHKP